jgi:DNA polymerase
MMELIRLRSEIDFHGWRSAARTLIARGIAPEDVEWVIGSERSLLGTEAAETVLAPSESLTVPRAFMALAVNVILHSDPQRFALLCKLLWRLRREPRLMNVASDEDVVRAQTMEGAVCREIHKTHAFVRFRAIATDDGDVHVAWFEPVHHTLERAAPFFARRFGSMRWSILTPRVSAHWDTKELTFGPGASSADAPDHDRLEDLWRTDHASIFNPARLKTRTMQAHMPRKYWHNMSETREIGRLVGAAAGTAGRMLEQPPTQKKPSRRTASSSVRHPPHSHTALADADSELEALRRDASSCTRCPLCSIATQMVFGEGPASATTMFVGEQPGDQEDLAGRPFVGPAGQLFDRALREAGIERSQVYVTNAVKHFKFEPRGKRRLHKTPAQLEIEACRHWLEREILLVEPQLIVAMGATAAHAILGAPTPIQRNRGKLIAVSKNTQVLVTVHPSYVLRIPQEAQPAEFERFVRDLRLAQPFCAPSDHAENQTVSVN